MFPEINGGEVWKFNARGATGKEFDGVWDARGNRDVDINHRYVLPASEICEGTKVLVEAQIFTWEVQRVGSRGGSLKLLSIGLLEKANAGFSFSTPRRVPNPIN